jgi:hypothetical protein
MSLPKESAPRQTNARRVGTSTQSDAAYGQEGRAFARAWRAFNGLPPSCAPTPRVNAFMALLEGAVLEDADELTKNPTARQALVELTVCARWRPQDTMKEKPQWPDDLDVGAVEAFEEARRMPPGQDQPAGVKTRRREPVGAEYRLVPTFLPHICELTRV